MCNKLTKALLPFIKFLCPLPSTAVHVIAQGGRHTNGKSVLDLVMTLVMNVIHSYFEFVSYPQNIGLVLIKELKSTCYS